MKDLLHELDQNNCENERKDTMSNAQDAIKLFMKNIQNQICKIDQSIDEVEILKEDNRTATTNEVTNKKISWIKSYQLKKDWRKNLIRNSII